MRRDQFQIIAPEQTKHAEELIELMGKVFSHMGYYEFTEYCRKAYINHSHYDWETSRIGILGGRIVTHVGVWDYDMRIGGARVRVAGVDGHDVEQLAAPVRAEPDGRPLAVLARTDPCRGMPPMRARAPRLHYVRFTDDDERRAFHDLLDEL